MASTLELLLLAQVAYLQRNTPQLIQTVTLASPSSSPVNLSPIPTTYNFLRLEWRAHLTSGGATDLLMQVDGHVGANYLWSKMESISTTQSNQHAGSAVALMKIGAVGGTNANYFGNGSLTIGGWSDTGAYMSYSGTSTYFDSNTVDYIGTYGGLYAVVAPHTSLQVYLPSGSFAAGSQFSLYGLT